MRPTTHRAFARVRVETRPSERDRRNSDHRLSLAMGLVEVIIAWRAEFLVEQIELGHDTPSFAQAVRSALRQLNAKRSRHYWQAAGPASWADCGYQDTAKPRPRTRRVRRVKPTAHNLTHISGIEIFGNSIPAETVGGEADRRHAE